MLKVIWGIPAESPKRVSRTFQTQRARILKKSNLAWTLENFKLLLEISNLAWKLQSRLKFSILTLRIPPTEIGVWWVARLKFSISLENAIRFNLAWKFQSRRAILKFFKIWALWGTLLCTGEKCLKRGFAPCKRLFWESHLRGPRTPFAPSLSTFGDFGCFDSCTRATESQPKGSSRTVFWFSWVDKRVVFQKGGFDGCSPGTKNRNQGTFRCSRNETRNEGTFACSPGTKTGTRAHSPKPPFYETALLSPSDSTESDSTVFYYSVVNLLRIAWWFTTENA